MKFVDAWDSIAKENKNLKILLFSMSLVAIFLSISTFKAVVKDPLVIERGCYSKILPTQKNTSEDEIKQFVKEALEARFNFGLSRPSFLSIKQKELREREQKELNSRNMKQVLVISEVNVQKDKILVKADRLISVGEIRSAFSFPLLVSVESTDRSFDNPYGLVLTEVSSPNSKEQKNEDK
ncbi:MAG: hypothetical protein IPM57_02535 [Oligoflexia bacterium]|nr:hypothetical protein [Oligoflexia bacterium]